MLHVTPVPAFRDNYIWAIQDSEPNNRSVVLVDPGEPSAILAWLADHDARPVAVLVTHHHNDHTGALPALTRYGPIPVYGPKRENIAGVTHPVGEQCRVAIPELGITFDVLETPGHTRGHVCYYGQGWLFAGDTLFSCGCGRLFEGSAEQMYDSLQRLARLPPDTRLYCAHEYTLPNIGFAREAEPDNTALEEHYRQARALRKAGLPTLPSSIGLELAINPFLRCHETTVSVAISQHDGLPQQAGSAAFARLRRWKDSY